MIRPDVIHPDAIRPGIRPPTFYPSALIFTLLTLMAMPASAAEVVGGPDIAVASVEGGLQVGRVTSVLIELENVGRVPDAFRDLRDAGLGIDGSEALGIRAELVGSGRAGGWAGGGVDVLSGPVPAGSLRAGEKAGVQFSLEAPDDAGQGVYPFVLRLTYSMLSKIDVSGTKAAPGVSLRYEDGFQTLPIEIRLMKGPEISVEAGDGIISPGDEADVEAVFVNSGDKRAEGLRVVPLPQPPFDAVGSPINLGDLIPGGSATARFRASVADGTPQGEYAIGFDIEYLDGRDKRSESLVALFSVDEGLKGRLIAPAVILAIALIAVVLYSSGVFPGRRKRWGRR